MSTSKVILQGGITNGDYEAAGFSGQLDVVTLDTYNESQTVTAVVVPIVIIAVLVVAIVVAVVLLL